jgi:hypothetical protein
VLAEVSNNSERLQGTLHNYLVLLASCQKHLPPQIGGLCLFLLGLACCQVPVESFNGRSLLLRHFELGNVHFILVIFTAAFCLVPCIDVSATSSESLAQEYFVIICAKFVSGEASLEIL